MQDFGARLKQVREDKKITQHDLASRLRDRGFGTTQTTISRWESGQEPRMYVLRAIAEELGTTVDELTTEPDDAEAAMPPRSGLSGDECVLFTDLVAQIIVKHVAHPGAPVPARVA